MLEGTIVLYNGKLFGDQRFLLELLLSHGKYFWENFDC